MCGVWTAEDAAVAADTAMDCGVPYAELWRYVPPDVVYQLAKYPELFIVLLPRTPRPWSRAWAGVRIVKILWSTIRCGSKQIWRVRPTHTQICMANWKTILTWARAGHDSA